MDNLEVSRNVMRLLEQFRSCMILQGGISTVEELRKMTLDKAFDICVRNNITVHFWPQKHLRDVG